MKSRDDFGLFDYQVDMKSSLYEAWYESRSVMCQMPTGTGKTHLLVSVVRDYVRSTGAGVWIVVHRIELVDQISSTLSRYGVSHGLLVSGKGMSGDLVQVVSIQTISSLLSRGRLSVLSPAFLSLVAGTSARGMDSGHPPREVRSGRIPVPGLLVIDEAHHAPARSYARLWELFPNAYKLGLTATPCRLNRGGFTSLFDRLLTSRSVSRFIEEGRLALFDYLSILPDSLAQRRVDSLSKRGADGDYSLKEMGSVLDCPEAIADLYEAYRTFVPGKKGIVYAVNRSHSLHICECYRSHGVRAASIDSLTPALERRECVERYSRGEIDVLVNVDIFSEGFDCPAVEFIQLARPTLSLSKYLQQVGRGLRVHPSKVRTVILDQVGLYLRFGLPTEERDWQAFFRGFRSGKGMKDASRAAWLAGQGEQCDSRFSSLEMGVVQGYEEFLREAANRRAEVEPYQEDGLYGLRKGDEVILPPSYVHIAPFVDGYAVVTYGAGRCGIVTGKGNLLPLPKCLRIHLYRGGLAYVEESPLIRYYLDLKTFERYAHLPVLLQLDFLEFVYNEGYYSLRIRQPRWKVFPFFSREDLTIEGDLFFHGGIFVHRSSPSEIYWYEYTDTAGNLMVSDRHDNLYLCAPGKSPVYYGVKKWIEGMKRWKYVKQEGNTRL